MHSMSGVVDSQANTLGSILLELGTDVTSVISGMFLEYHQSVTALVISSLWAERA